MQISKLSLQSVAWMISALADFHSFLLLGNTISFSYFSNRINKLSAAIPFMAAKLFRQIGYV